MIEIGIVVTNDVLQMCRYMEKNMMKALSSTYLLSPGMAIRVKMYKDQERQFCCIVILNI